MTKPANNLPITFCINCELFSRIPLGLCFLTIRANKNEQLMPVSNKTGISDMLMGSCTIDQQYDLPFLRQQCSHRFGL
jgi:hypothetical protein